MIKKIDNSIFDAIIRSKIFILLTIYIIIGAVFTSFQFSDQNWICMLLQILTNKIYLTIFIYPTILVLSIQAYKLFSCNHMIVLRMHDKTKLLNEQLKIQIKIISYLYLIVLICMGIAVNITPHGNNMLSKIFEYNSYDSIVLLVSVFKIYFSIVLFEIITLILLNKTNNEKMTIIGMFIYMMLLFLNTRLYFSGVLYYLNPNIHIYYFQGFNNIGISILLSIIFYIVIIPAGLLILKKNLFKKKGIGEIKNV